MGTVPRQIDTVL